VQRKDRHAKIQLMTQNLKIIDVVAHAKNHSKYSNAIKPWSTSVVDACAAEEYRRINADWSIGEALESITVAPQSHVKMGGVQLKSLIPCLVRFWAQPTLMGREATMVAGDRSVNFSAISIRTSQKSGHL